MSSQTRQSNFELLRILSMSMIILLHFGAATDLLNGPCIGICNMGVSCFILISGYFGLHFSSRKLLSMELTMIGYSLLETLLLYLFLPEQLQGAALVEQIAKSLIPFASRKYWFYSCYICLFLFSDYIRKLIDQLSRQEFEKLLAIGLLVFSIFPTLFYFEIMQDAGKGLIQMLLLYFVGRYIRLYKDISLNKPIAIAVFLFLWGLNTITILHPLRIGSMVHSLCRDDSITNLAMAVILFYLFKDISFHSGLLNSLTRNMFAVFALENSISLILAALYIDHGLIPGTPLGKAGFLSANIAGILLSCLLIGKIKELFFFRRKINPK